jgi:diguanylate cyclase (GGDEF)-like protein
VEIQRELTKKNLNLELLNKRLEELATTDPLTGIFNRRAVLERVRLEFNRALRENESCGMAILDLDDFKRINDQFGHLMGDEALRITSKCLKDSTREYDVAGRFGGDEFLVFFSVKSLQEFEKILNRLLAEINNHTMDISGELTVRIKASIGGVFIDPGNITGELGINMLMKKADDALYNAKDKGGNNVNIYGKFRGLLI